MLHRIEDPDPTIALTQVVAQSVVGDGKHIGPKARSTFEPVDRLQESAKGLLDQILALVVLDCVDEVLAELGKVDRHQLLPCTPITSSPRGELLQLFDSSCFGIRVV